MNAGLTRLNRRFRRKRAFITGAASGLGLAVARQLAAAGWVLGLFDSDERRLTQVEVEFSEAAVPVLAYPGDVTLNELTVAVNSFTDTHDGLDLMINNAGVAAAGAVMETDLSDWRWAMEINFLGVLHGCQVAIPHLQRNGGGLIVNVSSAAAFASVPAMGPYNASNAATLSLSETLHAELNATGIQVSVVMPTYFKSSLLDTLRAPPAAHATALRLMNTSQYPVEDVARDLLRLVSRGRTHIVLPRSARWLWRMKRWFPTLYLQVMARS